MCLRFIRVFNISIYGVFVCVLLTSFSSANAKDTVTANGLKLPTVIINSESDFETIRQDASDARRQGEMIKSEHLTTQLLLFADKSKNASLMALAMFEQAFNHMEQNQYDQAVPIFQTTIEMFKSQDNIRKTAESRINLAQTYKFQANYPEALGLAYSVLQIYKDLGDPDEISSTHNEIANIFEAMGHYKKRFSPIRKHWIWFAA